MSLFKRQPKTPAPRGGVAGLPELARARGWTAVDGVPFGPGLVDRIWHATWTVYDRRERLSVGAGNDPWRSCRTSTTGPRRSRRPAHRGREPLDEPRHRHAWRTSRPPRRRGGARDPVPRAPDQGTRAPLPRAHAVRTRRERRVRRALRRGDAPAIEPEPSPPRCSSASCRTTTGRSSATTTGSSCATRAVRDGRRRVCAARRGARRRARPPASGADDDRPFGRRPRRAHREDQHPRGRARLPRSQLKRRRPEAPRGVRHPARAVRRRADPGRGDGPAAVVGRAAADEAARHVRATRSGEAKAVRGSSAGRPSAT